MNPTTERLRKTQTNTLQVELDFNLKKSRPRANGVALKDPNLDDPDINLRFKQRDTLEFESDEPFKIKMIPAPHRDIKAGPEGNLFTGAPGNFEADSIEQHGINKVVCGSVHPSLDSAVLPCSYKYIATLRADPTRMIDPHIIVR